MAANRRKILVPLATLTVAGAVAVGSGASFTSTTASTTAVSSGNVTHSTDITTMDITNIKDGDTIKGSVTITNTGTIDSTLTIAETDFAVGQKSFLPGDLTLTLVQDGNVATPVYSGDFGGMTDDVTYDLGALPVGESTTVEFTVVLDEATDNTNENASATAAFQWVSTQVDGEDLDFVTNVFDGITFGD